MISNHGPKFNDFSVNVEAGYCFIPELPALHLSKTWSQQKLIATLSRLCSIANTLFLDSVNFLISLYLSFEERLQEVRLQ